MNEFEFWWVIFFFLINWVKYIGSPNKPGD